MEIVAEVDSKDKNTIMKAANMPQPKEADKQALQELFKNDPTIWRQMSDFPKKIEEAILNKMMNAYSVKESYRRRLAAMRDGLGWNNSNEMERLLIEQICLTWLRHNVMEMVHLEKTEASHNVEVGHYWDKILTSSQKRYLRAVESLAKVRKLMAEANLKNLQADKLKPPIPKNLNLGTMFKQMADELGNRVKELDRADEGKQLADNSETSEVLELVKK